jgi:hypothetical protein
MTYNAAGQMTQASKGSTTSTYTYAGPDQVEMVKAGNATLVYGLADQNNQPWIQSYSNGTSTAYIEHDGNGTPLGFFDGSNDYAYATDGLGSVVAVVSPSGTQAASYTYAPYGETTPDTGWEASINLLRYTGAFTDPGPTSPNSATAITTTPKADSPNKTTWPRWPTRRTVIGTSTRPAML